MLMGVGGCWCVGGCWWVLVGVGRCWCVLVGIGGCWWVLVGVGGCWCETKRKINVFVSQNEAKRKRNGFCFASFCFEAKKNISENGTP